MQKDKLPKEKFKVTEYGLKIFEFEDKSEKSRGGFSDHISIIEFPKDKKEYLEALLRIQSRLSSSGASLPSLETR